MQHKQGAISLGGHQADEQVITLRVISAETGEGPEAPSRLLF